LTVWFAAGAPLAAGGDQRRSAQVQADALFAHRMFSLGLL